MRLLALPSHGEADKFLPELAAALPERTASRTARIAAARRYDCAIRRPQPVHATDIALLSPGPVVAASGYRRLVRAAAQQSGGASLVLFCACGHDDSFTVSQQRQNGRTCYRHSTRDAVLSCPC